jgi:hypothetical protein
MNWEAIGAIGQVAGAIAVFVTLLYLAIQIRRSNELSRFSATKEIMNQFNDLNKMVVSDSELRQLLHKNTALSADEQERLYNFAMMYCNVWASIQTAYDNGQVDKAFFSGGMKDVQIEIDRWPNFCSAIERWLSNYPELAHYEIFQRALNTGGKA